MTTTSTLTPEDLLAHTLVQEGATAVRVQPDRDRPLRPWLGEVLRNLVRMRARGHNRWQARVHKLGENAAAHARRAAAYHEARRVAAEAVAQLEEPYRSTVLLCYAQEIEPSEIARQQGVPAGTVRWRLERGLDQVRRSLDTATATIAAPGAWCWSRSRARRCRWSRSRNGR